MAISLNVLDTVYPVPPATVPSTVGESIRRYLQAKYKGLFLVRFTADNKGVVKVRGNYDQGADLTAFKAAATAHAVRPVLNL